MFRSMQILLVLVLLLNGCKVVEDFRLNGAPQSGSTSDVTGSNTDGGASGGSGGSSGGGSGGTGGSDGGYIPPAGGGGGGGDSGSIPGWANETFIQNQFTERYDFLWVVDNSGSMSNIRTFMQQNLTNFVSLMEARRELDWQMAVTITDNRDYAGNLVSAADGTRVVAYDTPSVASTWASIISRIPATSHAGWEQGLESGRSAIDRYGAEFTRPNTPLIVTYITDEEDYSCETNCHNFSGVAESYADMIRFSPASYVSHFQQIATQLDANVIVYPIVHLQPLGGSNPCQDDYGSAGNRYKEVQSLMGTGQSLSICEQDLAASFDRVAQLTANLGVCFTLAHAASTTTGMEVSIDNALVPASASDGYVYEASTHQVCFSGSAIPLNGSSIKVKYRL